MTKESKGKTIGAKLAEDKNSREAKSRDCDFFKAQKKPEEVKSMGIFRKGF